MLTKDHLDNFNDKHMRIYVPTFAQDSPDFDKIWLTFLWMVGQNYGFDRAYHFHHSDYKLLTSTVQGKHGIGLTHEFNQRHGKWIKLAFISSYWNVAYFRRTDWEFAPYDLVDPRMQRAMVHLYNSVWAGNDLSSHLFETEETFKSCVPVGKSEDTGWFSSTDNFKDRVVERRLHPDDQPPHYLAQQWKTYKKGNAFAGKIQPQKIISNE